MGILLMLEAGAVSLAQEPDPDFDVEIDLDFDEDLSPWMDPDQLRDIRRNAERAVRQARRQIEDARALRADVRGNREWEWDIPRGFSPDPVNDELFQVLRSLRGDQRASELLIARLDSATDPTLRSRIIDLLGDMEGDDIINALANVALNDTVDELAVDAIDGIAEQENDMAVTTLNHIYENVAAPLRRTAAVEGLGETEQESAVPLVLGIYRSSDNEEVQRAAVRALQDLERYPAAVEGLLEVLQEV